jgi:hypothetical protein
LGGFVGFEQADREPSVIIDTVLSGAKGHITGSSLAAFKKMLTKGIVEADSADAAASAACEAVIQHWRFALHPVVAVMPLLAQDGAFASGTAATRTAKALLSCLSETTAVIGARGAMQRFDLAAAVC